MPNQFETVMLNILCNQVYGRKFEKTISTYCQPFFGDLEVADDMNKLDQQGIDVFQTDPTGRHYFRAVFQAKGFYQIFDDTHLDSCIKSLDAFVKFGKTAEEYYVVVNIAIDSVRKVKIKQKIAGVVASGQIKRGDVLDHKTFIKWMVIEADRKIYDKIRMLADSMKDQYIESTLSLTYVGVVPFSNGIAACRDSIVDRIILDIKNHSGQLTSQTDSTPALLTALQGEYGFGKTSAMLELLSDDEMVDTQVIYAPTLLFSEKAFSSRREFAVALFDLWFGNEPWTNLAELRLLFVERIETLLLSTDVVLMIDGLDEHPYFYSSQGLLALGRLIRDVNAFCIISARKEFTDDRSGDFTAAIQAARRQVTIYTFLDWDQPTIEDFAAGLTDEIIEITPEVKKFVDILLNGNWHQYFGDIPKRPLYLSMLVDSAVHGSLYSTKLGDLYSHYLENKISRDIDGFLRNPMESRPPLLQNMDRIKIVDCIDAFLVLLAGKMMQESPTGHIVFSTAIQEDQLIQAATTAGIPAIDTAKILVNSILVSDAERRRGSFPTRFAHPSFLDWYAAKYVVKNCPGKIDMLPPSAKRFAEGIA